ncbi:MAG: universal stress protein [Desulfovibrio sp.]|jgi:nucleotide-binding universal stress UspA family protein|nr:universal stress protein [Desulfovibrio sp.]MBQ1845598.1 universal stress protein [Desulfovibrio sp.]MBQ2475931.1 universal stress protein [Desulfovibrio sp.]MBQ2516238.1 universal stress protein [Desulfovibrio sp.]MBQ4124640.1 universal stress protein [Desulfovibrio sp.]
MKSIQKILCSIDLSEHSAEVAEYASLIASKLGAEVTVVYVAPTLSQYTGFKVPQSDIHAFVGEIVSGAQASMNAFVAEHFEGVKAEGEVLVGYASDEILAKAKRDGVDMIVMGTHGRKGIDRIIFGSVAEKVVKNSTIPVLTIRPSK